MDGADSRADATLRGTDIFRVKHVLPWLYFPNACSSLENETRVA